ncbi:MAG: type II secretion system F family protein [Candidatus Nanoarchaeia archaeon]|nr:type II secretion system F family protein [Candidatus Nanoarchaeia archaeon]
MNKIEEQKYIKNFAKKVKKGKEKLVEEKYTIYKSNKLAAFSNKILEPLTMFLLNKFPDLFKPLLKSLKLVRFNMLSKSYISLMLLLTMLSFLVFSVFFSLVFLNPINGIALGFVFMIFTFIGIYFYPQSDISTRKKRIKNELPFAIIHMAAVAGSGTPPINIFSLLVKSESEYPELSKEFKKILNYINIFGYNLSTALKAVAETTPSTEFKELLNGIISSIETGGNLRAYLDGMSKDALSTYQLERKKYVESIATYSDIYTALLVAAPLLFITTLTIINVIGGAISGISVTTIATVGTFVVIPAMNLAFIIFLNLTQQEV